MSRRPKRPLTIQECRALLSAAPHDELPALVHRLRRDKRATVREAAATAARRLEAMQAEERRLEALHDLQSSLHERGLTVVAGVDEVGRGALAGPVSAGAVVLPVDARIPRLNDSKMLTPEEREEIAPLILEVCVAHAVAHVSHAHVDRWGIVHAVLTAMREALASLGCGVEHVLVDGLPMDLGLPATAVIDGDAKVASIAAASVVAKVTRDALMTDYDAEYPGYGFAHNKGYSTPEHLEAIDALGLCDLHRRSFAPCTDQLGLFDAS